MQPQTTPQHDLHAPLPTQRRLHPLIGAAAVAVVIASLTAVAAVTGVLPIGKASTDLQPQTTQQTPQGPLPVTGKIAANPGTDGATPDPAQTAPPPGSTTHPPVYDDGRAHTARQQGASPRPQAAPRSAPARQAAPYDGAGQPAQAERQPPKGSPYAGRVVAVTPVQTAQPASGLGAVGGAVVGGLLGNQVGKGNGRIVGTVVGALGGGYAGNEVEKAVRKETHYEVRVKMDDGSHRSFTYQSAPGVQPGDRVHLENGALVMG